MTPAPGLDKPAVGSSPRTAKLRDKAGNLLLLIAHPEPEVNQQEPESTATAAPVRAWLVEQPQGTHPSSGPLGRRRARLLDGTAERLLRLGNGGVWPPTGLLTDLLQITEPAAGSADLALFDPETLCDPGLGVLCGKPGIQRLRILAARVPRWNPDARAAFAWLLTTPLTIPEPYAPLDGTSPCDLRTGAMTWPPGGAGVTRTGPLTRLRPTELALLQDLRTVRLAKDLLLYRQHRAPAPPALEPVTIILDTTPRTYGPAGNTLRLAAHLITATLWAHRRYLALVTLAEPDTAQLCTPADLLRIWTSVTLEKPGSCLAAAQRTADALGQARVCCTHWRIARGHGYVPLQASRLLTAHQPSAPAKPLSRWHAHLPPGPGQAALAAAVGQLLIPAPTEGSHDRYP